MILAVTVLLSAIVISINQVAEIPRGKELLLYALDGVCMEIPQRMMMQTFSGVLFMHWGLDLYLSIPVTAFAWCISICIQCLICKLKFDRENSNRDSGILSVFYGSRITIIKKRIYWTTYGRTFFRTYFEYNYP